MTAGTDKPRVRRERRIIERPRLIKLLDESEARIILLLAPAGYGKTTLARQWAKTLSGAIWVSLTPAHRDVARIAETIASGVDALGGDAREFISEYLVAKGNPQRAGRRVALALADRLLAARVQWIVFDDYHEVDRTPEITEFMAALQDAATFRTLVTARARPSWATSRRRLYGDVLEIGREGLAMDDDETRRLLGRRPELLNLVVRAEGWPAVLSLAASGSGSPPPAEVMPAELYAYLADEIYKSASPRVQELLLGLALAPELTDDDLPDDALLVGQIRELGFLSTDHSTELHPLVREFLLQKLAATRRAESDARGAVAACIERQRWDRAFELVLRFKLNDLAEQVLEASYPSLVRSGHLGTLAGYTHAAQPSSGFPPPVVDLIEAEVALQDGALRLASDLATRARERLPDDHRLASRARAIIAQVAMMSGDPATAVSFYRAAQQAALSDQDEADALYGWAITAVQGEVGDPRWAIDRLAKRRHKAPLDLVRYGCADLSARRFGPGFPGDLAIEEVLRALPRVEDPRARTSFAYASTYVLILRSEYREAQQIAEIARSDVDSFGLDFVQPHTDSNLAFVSLGLRRFGAAERYLQLVEDASRERQVGLHVLNARILRIRLALQTGQLDRAIDIARLPDHEIAIPSLHGEYLVTRALCLAVAGSQPSEALRFASAGESATAAVEVKVLAQAVRAIVAASQSDPRGGIELFELASKLGTWDPVVLALRTSARLRELIEGSSELRPQIEGLYQRSNDRALARRAGFRSRVPHAPDRILSPREMEVLELMARGFRNRDISKALVIADSTTKVHVRHILEKLGVHTRTEAVARLQMLR